MILLALGESGLPQDEYLRMFEQACKNTVKSHKDAENLSMAINVEAGLLHRVIAQRVADIDAENKLFAIVEEVNKSNRRLKLLTDGKIKDYLKS